MIHRRKKAENVNNHEVLIKLIRKRSSLISVHEIGLYDRDENDK